MVQRTYSDSRYVLCLCCVVKSVVFEITNQIENAIQYLSESLIWFPRSIEAIQRYSALLRTQADTTESLDYIEELQKRGLGYSKQIQSHSNFHNIEKNILQSELKHAKFLAENAGLLLCQRNKYDEADSILFNLGFTWRLSHQVRFFKFSFISLNVVLLQVIIE